MAQVLVIYTAKASFVRQDVEFLHAQYGVKEMPFDNRGTLRLLCSLIKQFFLLPALLLRCRLVYIWFGDYHSFLPIWFARLLGRKAILVVGGYDVVRNTALKYGSFKNPIRGACTLYSLKHASVNLCVSNNVLRKVKAIAPRSKTTLLYNGVPLRPFLSVPKKTNKVICVAALTTAQKLAIKGIDRLVETARIAPEFEFWLIGVYPKSYPGFIESLPANVKWVEHLPQEALLEHLADAHIYLQLSREESFCLAMAEAMLCNCTPLYTPAGGLPEVAGPCGESIVNPEPQFVLQALKKWKATEVGNAPSEWIRTHFLLEQRYRGLAAIIDPILH